MAYFILGVVKGLSQVKLTGNLLTLKDSCLVREGADQSEGGGWNKLAGDGLDLETFFIGNIHEVVIGFLRVCQSMPMEMVLAISGQ